MTRNIQEVISQMTVEEKASLCSGLNMWQTKPVERLGIPSIVMTDGSHGLRKQGNPGDMSSKTVPATCFPSGAGLASSWDRELIQEVGKALGEECQAEDVQIILGPAVNIKRSPLCGRNFEYFSEPYMVCAAHHPNSLPVYEVISVADLEKKAKEEGSVVSVGMPDSWANWKDTWTDLQTKYTLAHTDTDMSSAEEVAKFDAEKDKPTADIGDVGIAFGPVAIDKGVTQAYKTSYWDEIPDWAKDKDGHWVVGYQGSISFLTNKKLVQTPTIGCSCRNFCSWRWLCLS